MLTALLQATGSPEVQASLGGLQLAALAAVTLIVPILGGYVADYFRGKRELSKKELELKRLEVDEKISTIQRRIALDAAAIAEETGRSGKLSGAAKASLAAAKVEELLHESAAPNVEGSKLNDLVKLGVAQLRQSTYLLSNSMAPPPDVVVVPVEQLAGKAALPPPAALPVVGHGPATKTSPERPTAKR